MRPGYSIVLLAALSVAGCATTGGYDSDDGRDWDTNGDGHLDVNEFRACVDVNGTFAAWDSDGSGYVSEAEYRGGLSGSGVNFSPASGYHGWDLDSDGRIEPTEFLVATFQEVDVDGDRLIDNGEFRLIGYAIGLRGKIGPAGVRTAARYPRE